MQTKPERDALIQDAVIEALRNDDRVLASDVGVEVHAGVVTLTGTVRTWGARTAAQEAAHGVAEVRDVANEIVVGARGSPQHPVDVDVAHSVRTTLEAASPLLSRAVTSTVSDGIVTLEGTVEQREDREALARAATTAPGVRRVRNWIAVRPPARPERALHVQIARALARHAEHAAKHVDVAFSGDVVRLSGVVRSESERDAVVGAVKGAPGVTLIDSRDLRVVP